MEKNFSVKNSAEIQKVIHFLTALKGFDFDRFCGASQCRLFCEPDTVIQAVVEVWGS